MIFIALPEAFRNTNKLIIQTIFSAPHFEQILQHRVLKERAAQSVTLYILISMCDEQ